MAEGHTSAPSNSVLQKKVLDQLVDKKLQLQIAKQVGIHFSDEDIDRIVQNVASKNNISVAALYQRINSEGMSTSEYRNELREQMIVQKLQQQEVASRIVVTPDEINTFMRSKLVQNNGIKEYRLEDVLIALSETPSSDEVAKAKKQAESVIANLQQGEKVTSATDLGWRKLAEIPSVFTQQVINMQTNEVAGPIKAPNGLHVIRLVAERSTGDSADAPNRSQVEQMLIQRKFQQNVQNWVSKMRSQAFISMNVPNETRS
jgi:peptidyl-prolyl cis-trans isomerase SurA